MEISVTSTFLFPKGRQEIAPLGAGGAGGLSIEKSFDKSRFDFSLEKKINVLYCFCKIYLATFISRFKNEQLKYYSPSHY